MLSIAGYFVIWVYGTVAGAVERVKRLFQRKGQDPNGSRLS